MNNRTREKIYRNAGKNCAMQQHRKRHFIHGHTCGNLAHRMRKAWEADAGLPLIPPGGSGRRSAEVTSDHCPGRVAPPRPVESDDLPERRIALGRIRLP